MKLVIVFYIHAQAGVPRKLRIACRKLLFVVIQKEIEWITLIHVDEHQIRIVHDQLTETYAIVFEGHVISSAYVFHRLVIGTPKNLNDFVAFHSYGDHLPFKMG